MKYLMLFVIIFCSVNSSLLAQDSKKEVVQLSDPVMETSEYSVFGSEFNKKLPAIALSTLVNRADQFDTKTVTTEGTIKQVCQKKGCFFMLQGDDDSTPARITFKDYSFFIPTNAAGSRVKLNGTFSVKTISEEDAKHYAKDTGQDPETIIGPQKEYALTATSVVIYK